MSWIDARTTQGFVVVTKLVKADSKSLLLKLDAQQVELQRPTVLDIDASPRRFFLDGPERRQQFFVFRLWLNAATRIGRSIVSRVVRRD
jgi:hypothetical protein